MFYKILKLKIFCRKQEKVKYYIFVLKKNRDKYQIKKNRLITSNPLFIEDPFKILFSYY